MNSLTIHLPQTVYETVLQLARQQELPPDRFVSDFLQQQLLAYPHIDHYLSRAGTIRPIVRGTRVGVEVIVGYHQAGYSPQEIVTDILPHLTLAQIYAALSYYEDNWEQMDQLRQANTAEVWQERLKQEMGVEAAHQLLGINEHDHH